MYEGDLVADAEQFRVLGRRLAGAITADVSGTAAAAVLTEVLAAARFAELATCRAVERVDRTGEFASDGSASSAAFLRECSGESHGWASKRVLLGRALADRMPTTAAGWERGDLGLSHADIIRTATAALDEELAADIEKVLADAAPQLTPGQLGDLADAVKAAAAPEDAEAAAARRRDSRTVSISKSFDGMWRLDGWLDSEDGAEFAAAIDSFTRRRDPGLSAFEDPIGRRRAEALLQLARHATAHAETCEGDGPPKRTLVVSTSLETLQDGVGFGDVEGGGILTAGAVRRLACDAGIIPAVLGADSEILDLGRQTRLATPAMRRKLALRDGGCLFPGCDRPPSWSEAHHRRHRIDGGPTSVENLDSFCCFHHHLVHEGGWTYQIVSPTELHFTPPGGGPIRVSKRQPSLGRNLNNRLHPDRASTIPMPRRT